MTSDDDRLLSRLAEGLAPAPRSPSDERVIALRAHAARWQQRAAADPSADPQPVPLAPRRSRREVPRRDILTGAAAATIGAALGAVGLEAFDEDPRPGPPTEPVEVAATPPDVDAQAELINHTWGIEIILTATGLAPGGAYRAAVQPLDGGDDVSAGSFLGVASVPVVCRMNASILRAAASSFTVVDGEGAAVITGRFA